jgi:hypothetical protein
MKERTGSSIEINVMFNASSFYNMLIVVPENIDCFEVVNILNYYGFPINLEEDNLMTNEAKKEMGFSKEMNYPFLVIDSSTDEMPPADLSEKDEILTFLHNAGLIGSYRTHSAFEKQG